jgi:hypothetical protein
MGTALLTARSRLRLKTRRCRVAYFQNKHVEAAPPRGFQTLHDVRNSGDGMALLFHPRFELVRELPVVFDDEDPHRSASNSMIPLPEEIVKRRSRGTQEILRFVVHAVIEKCQIE